MRIWTGHIQYEKLNDMLEIKYGIKVVDLNHAVKVLNLEEELDVIAVNITNITSGVQQKR